MNEPGRRWILMHGVGAAYVLLMVWAAHSGSLGIFPIVMGPLLAAAMVTGVLFDRHFLSTYNLLVPAVAAVVMILIQQVWAQIGILPGLSYRFAVISDVASILDYLLPYIIVAFLVSDIVRRVPSLLGIQERIHRLAVLPRLAASAVLFFLGSPILPWLLLRLLVHPGDLITSIVLASALVLILGSAFGALPYWYATRLPEKTLVLRRADYIVPAIAVILYIVAFFIGYVSIMSLAGW